VDIGPFAWYVFVAMLTQSPVPQGGTITPGAPVTAVPAPDGVITLFMADPAGVVHAASSNPYYASGDPAQGWGPWSSVPVDALTTPGAPVTAVLAPDGIYTLFMADPSGVVYTASGNPAQGWGGGWIPVLLQSDTTTPGAPVTAVLAPNGIITLFLADPYGVVWTTSGNSAQASEGIWTSVSPWTTVSPQTGTTTQGAPVTAVLAQDGTYTLFMADTGGVVRTASGSPSQGWGGGWTPVSPQTGTTTPGAPVTAVLAPDGIILDGIITLFMFSAVPGVGVCTVSGSLITASGNPAPVWGHWTSVSQGSTTPGAPVSAVLALDGTYTLFLADPGGGVYTASGSLAGGWEGGWTSVSLQSDRTTPGAPVTAVLGPAGIITLFMADLGGEVSTASGNRAQGWGPWSGVSQGITTPGAPVTAVLGPDGIYTLFMADLGGVVWTASGSPAQGWGDGWTSVSPRTGTTTPGAPVTAVLAPDGLITLFMFSAVPGIGVCTASGNPVQGWGPWSSVSQGSTTPGARITAVLAPGGIYTLFLADPHGGVYTAGGSPPEGWGDWAPVSLQTGTTTPGATVTAVLAPNGTYTLFMADTDGVVRTASGNPAQGPGGWGDGWTAVSPQTGTTTLGATVTAVLAPDGTYTLFMFSADPGVGVATASGNPAQGWGGGWSSVSQGTTTPGAPVSAVLAPDGTYTLFLADPHGGVYTASRSPAGGWGEWAPVSLQTGSSTPGATVTAVLGPDGTIPDGIITLFLADLGGEVSTASGNPAPGWGEWAPVSPQAGSTTPGVPVTAVMDPDEIIITLFMADPGGRVYTASGNLFTASGSSAPGWGPWSSVSEGSTTPGAPVTAVVAPDGTYTLFLADPGGGVYTASGSPAGGWGDWVPVSPQTGTTTPGAPVTAVLAPDGIITLFMADPGGVVRTASGNPAEGPGGWGGGWTAVSPQTGTTTPGATVTAVLAPGGTYTLFMADRTGEVCTTSGNAQRWAEWSGVSPGLTTTPGAPITAVLALNGNSTLFLAVPGTGVGTGVGTASGNPAQGWGEWSLVSQGSTTPGARVTAVLAPGGTYTLFMADPGGVLVTAGGSPAGGWGDWTPVSQGVSQASTTPGAPVTAVLAPDDGIITLFLPTPGYVTLSWI